jgi:hypothetical protein
MNAAISGASTVISLVFTLLVFKQYLHQRAGHHLIWSLALLWWVIAGASELVATLKGWSPLTYRLYYAAGALVIPAWLGLGTLLLLAPRRLANLAVRLVSLASLAGLWLILTWPIPSPTALQQAGTFIPVQIFPFIPVRLWLVILNALGTLAFVGGALYSAWAFWRRQMRPERVVGTLLIAAGGLVAAGAHSLGALGHLELFRPSELVAVILIFSGFLWTTRRRATAETAGPQAS